MGRHCQPQLLVPSSPGVAGLATAPLPISLHELARQPLQRLRTDPASLAPHDPAEHPSTHHPPLGPKLGSPTRLPTPWTHVFPQSTDTHIPMAQCQQESHRAPHEKTFWGGSHHSERTPPLGLLGRSTRKGTSARDTGHRDRVEEPQQSQAQQDPNPRGMVVPSLGGLREGSDMMTGCRKRGDTILLQYVPKGRCRDISHQNQTDISEQRPAMTQQTAEPSSFLLLQGFPSRLPKHARFGPCRAQQSPQHVLNVVRVLLAG